jgi:hypothetical protein
MAELFRMKRRGRHGELDVAISQTANTVLIAAMIVAAIIILALAGVLTGTEASRILVLLAKRF